MIKPLTINFRLINGRSEYNRYVQSVAPDVSASQGLFIAKLNESVVWVKNDRQAIRTASHEAMHAMNRHFVGQMGKWLDEGLAELAEDFAKLEDETSAPISFEHLVNSSQEQWNANPNAYYASARYYVGHLYLNNKRELSRILLAEAENGCDVLSYNELSSIIGFKVT